MHFLKYVAHSALSYGVHYCSWETLSKTGDFYTALFFFGETFAWTCFYCQSLDTTVNDPLMTYVPQLQACYAMFQFLISENPDRGKPIEIDITPLPNTHITKSLKAGKRAKILADSPLWKSLGTCSRSGVSRKRVLGALTKEWLTIILAVSQQVFEHVGQGVARKRFWDLLAKRPVDKVNQWCRKLEIHLVVILSTRVTEALFAFCLMNDIWRDSRRWGLWMFLMSKSKAVRVTDERGNSELLSRGDRQQLKDSEKYLVKQDSGHTHGGNNHRICQRHRCNYEHWNIKTKIHQYQWSNIIAHKYTHMDIFNGCKKIAQSWFGDLWEVKLAVCLD